MSYDCGDRERMEQWKKALHWSWVVGSKRVEIDHGKLVQFLLQISSETIDHFFKEKRSSKFTDQPWNNSWRWGALPFTRSEIEDIGQQLLCLLWSSWGIVSHYPVPFVAPARHNEVSFICSGEEVVWRCSKKMAVSTFVFEWWSWWLDKSKEKSITAQLILRI